ncbi:MAG TPA: CbiQ family ECF transporter T component, partial [Bacillota bacterium]|nr:CbiQ family ECF transporter T component [Bacillota bacterium]
MLNIDGFAYTNRLRHVHPLEKAAFAFLTLLLSLVVSKPIVSCLVIIIMGLAIVKKAGIPAGIYYKLMTVPFSFVVLSVVTIAVSITTQPLAGDWLVQVSLPGVVMGITYGGLTAAAQLFFKSLAGVSCS